MTTAEKPDFDMWKRHAAYRVLQAMAAVTPQRQAKLLFWASAALSVVAITQPGTLPPDLITLKDLLNVGAINGFLKKVAGGGDKLTDEAIAKEMSALLPVDRLDDLAIGQKDLIQLLTKQQEWFEQIAELSKTNEEKTSELLAYVINITGDLYTIRQQLLFIQSSQFSEKVIQEVLNSLGTYSIDVPIVIAAMTEDQAISLMNKKVRSTYDYRTHSKYIKYSRMNNDQWVKHYQQKRDEWRPFLSAINGYKSIWDIVIDLIAGINASRSSADKGIVQPMSLTTAFFDPVLRSYAFTELIDKGGILIIDPFSLNHPAVLNEVVNSGALGNRHISTIVVNPLDQSTIEIHSHLKTMVETNLIAFFSRFDALDNRSEYCGGDLIYLQRWLFQQINTFKFENQNRGITPGKQNMLYSHTGIDRLPNGSELSDLFLHQ